MSNVRNGCNEFCLLVAFDLDHTCIYGDMADPLLKSKGVDPAAFWASTEVLTMSGLDLATAYTRQFTETLLNRPDGITEDDLVRVGEQLQLVSGLPGAIADARAAACAAGIELKVIVITSGLKAVVQASSLAACIDDCFGSTWHTDSDGRLVYPDQMVSADTKADILSHVADDGIPSKGIPPIPVTNFLYVGDGFSDGPAFKFVADGGGNSLLVHRGDLGGDEIATDMASHIDGLQTAHLDYRRGSAAHQLIMDHVAEIATNRDDATRRRQNWLTTLKIDTSEGINHGRQDTSQQ